METPLFDYSARKYIALQLLKEVLKHKKTYSVHDALTQVGQYLNEIYFCPVPLVYFNKEDEKFVTRGSNVIRDDILLFMRRPQSGYGTTSKNNNIYELCTKFCEETDEASRDVLVDEIRKEKKRVKSEKHIWLPADLTVKREQLKGAVERALEHGAAKEEIDALRQDAMNLVDEAMDMIKITGENAGSGTPLPGILDCSNVRKLMYEISTNDIIHALIKSAFGENAMLKFEDASKELKTIINGVGNDVNYAKLFYMQIICRLVNNIVFAIHTSSHCECIAIKTDIDYAVRKCNENEGRIVTVNMITTILLLHLIYGKDYAKNIPNLLQCRPPYESVCNILDRILVFARKEKNINVLKNIFLYMSCNMRGAKTILVDVVTKNPNITLQKLDDAFYDCATRCILTNSEQIAVFNNLIKLHDTRRMSENYRMFSFGVLELLHNYEFQKAN